MVVEYQMSLGYGFLQSYLIIFSQHGISNIKTFHAIIYHNPIVSQNINMEPKHRIQAGSLMSGEVFSLENVSYHS